MEWLEIATHGLFWKALLEIIIVNILLSGDNAVVIALAARSLPRKQQNMAILLGSAAAIVLRVILTIFAVALLQYPYLKLIGAGLLIWIGAKMLLPEGGEDEHAAAKSGLWGAVQTILIADLVMSLDNVIAVAAAAETGPPEGKYALLIIGLGLSIPLIIVGAQLLMKLMDRWPIIITLGAALLGFVAGEMAVTDPAIEAWFHGTFGNVDMVFALICAVVVVLIGKAWARRVEAQGA
jgi:YjbE family integral membrane protein